MFEIKANGSGLLMIYHIITDLLLAGVLLYVMSIACAINRMVAHNEKFPPPDEKLVLGALTAMERFILIPGEEVVVKVDGDQLRAKLVLRDEGRFALHPTDGEAEGPYLELIREQ